MLIEFPNDFPSEALNIVLDAWRNPDQIDKHEAAKCAWNVLGYGLGKGFPHPMMTGTESVASVPSKKAVEEAFAAVMAEGNESPQRMAASPAQGIIPWSIVLKIALEWLKKFIG